jgi:oligosaccharide repeat unit polymerase
MELAAAVFVGLTAFMLVVSPLGRVSPSALLSGAWALVYALQSVFASDMRSSLLATFTIFTVTLSFAAGELIGCGGMRIKQHLPESQPPPSDMPVEGGHNASGLKSVIILFSVFGLLGLLEYAHALGLFEARSLADLITLPGLARFQMNTGERTVPLYSRACVLFSYPAVILALAYYFLYKWRWWLALPMLDVLLFGMSQSGRAGSMIVLVQLLISVYLKQILVLKRAPTRVFLSCALAPSMLMVIVFIGGQFLREGFHSLETTDVMRVIDSLRSYLFGGVSAFSYWITNIYDWSHPSLGKYSFSSLFSALGIAAQANGVYDSYAPIAPNGDMTNLYTAYRSFIEDYSIVGASLCYFVAGIFIASIARSIVEGKKVLILVLIPLLSALAWSPLCSLTYFNSYLLSCFLPYLLVRRFWKANDSDCQIHVC